MNTLMLRPFESVFPSDMFEDLWRSFDSDLVHKRMNQGFPKFDLFTEGDKKVIEIALAGYSKDQLLIEVDGNKLIISANKVDDKNNDGRVIARRSFTKSFTDPSKHWDLNAAEVSFVDGLLKVVIPPMKPTEMQKMVLTIK